MHRSWILEEVLKQIKLAVPVVCVCPEKVITQSRTQEWHVHSVSVVLIRNIIIMFVQIATLLFTQSVFFVSNVFVGHLNDDPINLDASGRVNCMLLKC